MPRSAARAACVLAILALGGCRREEARSSAAASRPESGPAPSAFRMADVTDASGITFVSRSGERQEFIPEAKGTGVAILDYDGDGVLDLCFVAGSTLERERSGAPGFGAALYRGLGGLRYADVTAASGLPDLGWSSAPVAGDFDGDGRDDLLITGLRGVRLFLNARGVFRETTATALPGSARDGGWCTSAAVFDAESDGDLDVLVARYLRFDLSDPPRDGQKGRTCRWKGHPVICGPRGLEPLPAILLRNRGDGSFEDATHEAGIDAAKPAYGLGVLTLDFNRDGRTDVYVANDMTPSHLWRNDGGRFTEVGVAQGVAYSADGAPEAGMGVDAADLNGDGTEDVLKTNFEGEPNDVYLSSPSGYDEASTRLGIAAVDRPHVGWGCAIRDFDGDGLADLFVANGHVYPQADLPNAGSSYGQPKILHLGTPAGRFARFPGPGSEALATPKVSRAAAFGDLDDDGDTDVVVVNLNDRPTVLRCDAPPGSWLGIAVAGPKGNPHGLGATVTIAGDGWVRTQFVRAQASFQSTNDPRPLFRLRAVERPRSVEIALPGSAPQRFDPPTGGRWHELRVP
jgi:enediyne biosynthesis protein E4